MDDPKYVLLVLLDEPRATTETFGFATAGWNAVPTAGVIVSRIAPILGVEPRVTPEEMAGLVKSTGAGIPGD
jgi:cell division protein FtsI (penicillin-binding protein 3)